MGALNVAFFLLATRSEVVGYLPLWLRPFLGFYLMVYAGVALFFFLEAIEALRPRRFRPHVPYPGEAGPDHYPEGLRYYEDAVQRDVEAYRRAWREVRFGQLNAELAVQNHVMARINLDKYSSLRRLYGGLRVLTLLAGGLLAILALSMLFYHPEALPAASSRRAAPVPADGAADTAGAAALAAPAVVPVPGLGEASGLAWVAATGRFFVVGDQGSLAEVEPSGAVVATHRVRGNLEDVALHSPSGRLVLLAEKKGELVVWDPVARAETARFALDAAALLGREPADRNQGFEGLAFRPEAGRPGGGAFHLVHQRRPARLVSIAFDPTGPARALGAEDLVDSRSLRPFEDLTAVAWSERLGRLLVVAESADRLLVVGLDGAVERSVALPGARQEGLALDDAGALWLADERLGLLRLDGAEAALAERGDK